MEAYEQSSDDMGLARRAAEIERLLNPAYCAAVLAQFAHAYATQLRLTESGIPFPLIFLCLPMALHARTRTEINAHGKQFGLHRMIRGRSNLLIGLAERVEDFTHTTREAFLFGCAHGQLRLDAASGTVIGDSAFVRRLARESFDADARAPVRAAERLGAWCGQVTIAEVFLHLALRP